MSTFKQRMDNFKKIKLKSLLQKITNILEEAPNIIECDSAEEIYMYAEMIKLKKAMEEFLKD